MGNESIKGIHYKRICFKGGIKLFGFDRKTITIVLLVLLVMQALNSGTAGILATLFLIPGVLIAITFHEYAHALAAYKLGDETPKIQGRLNLNPASHVSLLGLIFLALAGFGWGKPVEINSRNFNGKYSLSKSEAIVAAAGPIMNFIVAFVLMIIFYIVFSVTTWGESLSTTMYMIVYGVLAYAISINIGLGVFNLIPLPPLDGSKILMHFLPGKGKQWFYENERMFYLIFFLLWITGLSSVILEPLFTWVYNGMNWAVANLIGLFI